MPGIRTRRCATRWRCRCSGWFPGDHAEGIEALIALSRDADTHVRDWATTALADVDADTHEIREALAARLDRPRTRTRRRRRPGVWRCVRIRVRKRRLARILADEDPDGYARETAADAVRHIQDERLRRRLEQTAPR